MNVFGSGRCDLRVACNCEYTVLTFLVLSIQSSVDKGLHYYHMNIVFFFLNKLGELTICSVLLENSTTQYNSSKQLLYAFS